MAHPDARGQIGGGQPGEVSQRRLVRAVGEESPAGGPAHGRGDAHHRPAAVIEHVRHGGPGEGVGGRHVEVEGRLQKARRGVQEGAGHRAADVVDHDVESAEGFGGPVGQRGDGVELGQVGRHRHGLATAVLDLARHLLELLLGASRDHDVGPRLGQGQRGGRPDAASGSRHHRHAVGQPEAIEDHRAPPYPQGRPGGAADLTAALKRVPLTTVRADGRVARPSAAALDARHGRCRHRGDDDRTALFAPCGSRHPRAICLL